MAAASGPEALELCERTGGPMDVLVTDMVMPGMSGRELADPVLAMHPPDNRTQAVAKALRQSLIS